MNAIAWLARAILRSIVGFALGTFLYLVIGGAFYRHANPRGGDWLGIEIQRAIVLLHADVLNTPALHWLFFYPGFDGNSVIYAERHFDTEPAAVQQWLQVLHASEFYGLLCAVGLFVLYFGIHFGIHRIRKNREKTRVVRELTAAVRGALDKSRAEIYISTVPIPDHMQPRGVLLVGAPGTGKTEAIKGLALGARNNNDTIAAIDRGGELTQLFFRPGDSIYCPLDKRSVKPSLLAEIDSDIDRDTISEMLFPLRGDSGPADFFQAAAGVVTKGILKARADTNNGILWRTISNKRELEAALKGTEAEQYLQAREWGGIYGNLMNSLQWLKHLPPEAGRNGDSVRRFIRESDLKPGRGLWVVIPKSAAAALNPMAALVVGLAAHEALSLVPSNARRIWLFTDELGNLPVLANFSTVMTEGRKHGICPVGGIQSIAQPRKIYGRDGAQELMSCFQTWMILRQADAESADAMSRHIGDKEVREWHQSEGASVGEGRNTSNRGRSEHVRVKRTVLARELQELPDLHGYLCLGHLEPGFVALPLIKLPAVAARFEPLPLPAATPSPPAPVPVAPELDLGALRSEQELEH